MKGDKPERNRLKRAFRVRALEDQEAYYSEIANDAETAAQRNDIKSIYRAVRRINSNQGTRHSTLPRKLDGTQCKSEEEALLRWTKYYSAALNHPPAAPFARLDNLASDSIDDPRIPVDAPSESEVLAAITKLNNGRSPGADGITAELLKHSSRTSVPLLVKLFASVWRSGKVPAEWKDGIVTSL